MTKEVKCNHFQFCELTRQVLMLSIKQVEFEIIHESQEPADGVVNRGLEFE